MKDQILDELVRNRDHYFELIRNFGLAKDILLQTEDDLFYEDILTGFKQVMLETISEDMIKRLNFPVDEVLGTLEEINLIDFFETPN